MAKWEIWKWDFLHYRTVYWTFYLIRSMVFLKIWPFSGCLLTLLQLLRGLNEFLTTSHVVIVVLRIAKLLLLFLLFLFRFRFSIFLNSDGISLYSIDMPCSCNKRAILKVQIISAWKCFFWRGWVGPVGSKEYAMK